MSGEHLIVSQLHLDVDNLFGALSKFESSYKSDIGSLVESWDNINDALGINVTTNA